MRVRPKKIFWTNNFYNCLKFNEFFKKLTPLYMYREFIKICCVVMLKIYEVHKNLKNNFLKK